VDNYLSFFKLLNNLFNVIYFNVSKYMAAIFKNTSLILIFLSLMACKDNPSDGASDIPIGLRVGNKAPMFTTYDINGMYISLADFKGSVVLLHFWATWCPYSRNSIGNLIYIWDNYASRNFAIISVSRDYDTTALRNYIQTHNLNWRHIHDSRYDVGQFYDVKVIPMCYLIDSQGIIRFAGSPLEPQLLQIIDKLIK